MVGDASIAIALRIGKGTVRKMRQNLGWAIGYNAVALRIAAGVLVSPQLTRRCGPDGG